MLCTSCRLRPARARLTVLLAGSAPVDLCLAGCLERALDDTRRDVNVRLEYVNAGAPPVNEDEPAVNDEDELEEEEVEVRLPLDHERNEPRQAPMPKPQFDPRYEAKPRFPMGGDE